MAGVQEVHSHQEVAMIEAMAFPPDLASRLNMPSVFPYPGRNLGE